MDFEKEMAGEIDGPQETEGQPPETTEGEPVQGQETPSERENDRIRSLREREKALAEENAELKRRLESTQPPPSKPAREDPEFEPETEQALRRIIREEQSRDKVVDRSVALLTQAEELGGEWGASKRKAAAHMIAHVPHPEGEWTPERLWKALNPDAALEKKVAGQHKAAGQRAGTANAGSFGSPDRKKVDQEKQLEAKFASGKSDMNDFYSYMESQL